MNNAIGAVRTTALGRRLAGSSKPRTACNSQRCIQWPSDKHRPTGFPALSNQASYSRTSDRDVSLPRRAQDDGQKSVLSRLVVQGLDRLDLQGGMQPELVKLEFRTRSVRIVGPLFHAGQPVPFLAGRSFAFFFLGRSWLVECSIGMHMADEVNVGRQVREDALTAVGAVTGDDDLLVGEPLGHHVDEFQG